DRVVRKLYDMPGGDRRTDIGGYRTSGPPVAVALDAQAEAAAKALKLRDPDRAELGAAYPQVAEAPGNVRVIGVKLGQQPGGGAGGVEELCDGFEVDLAVSAPDGVLTAAVVEQLGTLRLGQEFHGMLPCWEGRA